MLAQCEGRCIAQQEVCAEQVTWTTADGERFTLVTRPSKLWRWAIAEARDATGHANVSITSEYLHVVVVDVNQVGSLFV